MLFFTKKFQSLIGKLKTRALEPQIAAGIVFQSLIGKLKTQSHARKKPQRDMFQSLIGKLKTESGRLCSGIQERQFQSLIGKLKTPAPKPQKFEIKVVSIPYR